MSREYDEKPCWDCEEGRHEMCLHNGGWPNEDNNDRCSCHLTSHTARLTSVADQEPPK